MSTIINKNHKELRTYWWTTSYRRLWLQNHILTANYLTNTERDEYKQCSEGFQHQGIWASSTINKTNYNLNQSIKTNTIKEIRPTWKVEKHKRKIPSVVGPFFMSSLEKMGSTSFSTKCCLLFILTFKMPNRPLTTQLQMYIESNGQLTKNTLDDGVY